MLQTIHLKETDETARKIAGASFPDYTGKKFKLQVHDSGTMNLTSYWDGGSRDYFAVLRLEDMKCLPVPQNGTPFDPYGNGIEVPLPGPGFAVIEHSIFCGKDSGITIHVHSSNAAPLLPKTEDITWAEKVVLSATRSLKSSYAGIKDYRFSEAQKDTGITRADWDTAKTALIEKRLLNAAGAVTVDGKNAIGNTSLWNLKQEVTA